MSGGNPGETDAGGPAEAVLSRVADGVRGGPFAADWDSLRSYQVPRWYADAKLGIFVHWGPYSVPAWGNEWYPRRMYVRGDPAFEHHRERWGPQDVFGYKDFLPLFTGERFDAEDWATLFRRAGAQFVVPVAEHHDGFAMYDTDLTRWTAVRHGPRRDVIGELAAAVRRQSMVFGVSSHRAEHWWFFNGGMQGDSDVRDPAYADLYGPAQRQEIAPHQQFLADWLARTADLVERYDPQLVWFDWWIEQDAFVPWLQRFAAWYYNRDAERGRGVALNYKWAAFPDGTAVYDVERGQVGDTRPMLWQNDTSVAVTSWGWIADQRYKSLRDILGDLADVVAKNGVLLLNIGPRPDGSIADPERELLERLGDWLAVNGEAVYGTRPWVVNGEGPTPVSDVSLNDEVRVPFGAADIRYTSRYDLVYATALDWPADGHLVLRTLASGSPEHPGEIAVVELLGHREPLSTDRRSDGLHIRLPDRPVGAVLPVLRITPAERGPDARRHALHG